MHDFTKLRVFNEARQNLKSITQLLSQTNGFGDLHNQMRRSAISVVSNIAEGAGSGSPKQFARFLNIARGSNSELLAQALILEDLNTTNQNISPLIDNIQYTGKMLTKLIKHQSASQ